MTRHLPEGWATIRVGDYFQSWGGMTPSTSNASYWGGNVPWVSSKDIKAWRIERGGDSITRKAMQETRLRLCPVGSVLVVVRSGILAHTLPIAVVDSPVSINQDLKAFYSPDGNLNEWLALALRALAPEILTNNRKDGTTVQSVRYEELCDLIIPVPPSPEQRRINSRLTELIQGVRDTRQRLLRVPAILKHLREALLEAACSGRLTEGWRAEHPPIESGQKLAERIQQSHTAQALGHGGQAATPTEDVHNVTQDAMPDTWAVEELKILCQPGRSITYGILKPGPDVSGGVPYIRVADFPNNRLRLEGIRRTTKQIADMYRRSALREGDLLLSIRGTAGRVCRVPPQLDGANITQDTARISIHRELSSDYVEFYLQSPSTQDRLEAAMKGVAVRGVNIGDVRVLQVALPPRVEQDEIVRRIDAMLKSAEVIEQRLLKTTAKADKLTQSILAKAFRGELVPTEAELARREGREFEPASVLLERIRAERADHAKTASVPKRKVKQASANV
jgi:type I restriction enzyme S subunit